MTVTEPTAPEPTPHGPVATSTVAGPPVVDDRGSGARLGRVLRTGVVASAGLVLAGVAWSAATGGLGGGRQELDRRLEAGPRPTSLRSIVADLSAGRPEALVVLGLLVLVATPILRVAVAGLEFHRRRDRAFTAIAALVLVLLAVSFLAELAT